MSNQQTLKNNKLIAAFDGVPLSNIHVYHCDWNALMSVVLKIESMGFDFHCSKIFKPLEYFAYFTKDESPIRILHNMYAPNENIAPTRLEATYKAVIVFIEQYNREKKSNGNTADAPEIG